MALATSNVYKCLEKKTLILGFEVLDIFAICLLMCALNLLFANASLKILYTWIPTGLAAIGLRMAKLGKPENFLLHWVRYQMSPGVMSAFCPATAANDFLAIQKRRLRR
jgi:hypothetical protein